MRADLTLQCSGLAIDSQLKPNRFPGITAPWEVSRLNQSHHGIVRLIAKTATVMVFEELVFILSQVIFECVILRLMAVACPVSGVGDTGMCCGKFIQIELVRLCY